MYAGDDEDNARPTLSLFIQEDRSEFQVKRLQSDNEESRYGWSSVKDIGDTI